MGRPTVEAYEDRGGDDAAGTKHVRTAAAARLAAAVPSGALRADLGRGPGRDDPLLAAPLVGLDGARTVLERCRSAAPRTLLVQGDLAALPVRRGALQGAWAGMSDLHVPRVRLPLALGELHRALAVGSPLDLQVPAGDHERSGLPGLAVAGRHVAAWRPDDLAAVLTGAGFEVHGVEVHDDVVVATARRGRTLADTVGPDMRLLVCGLNPSLLSADVGTGFARPGNRFWPAALAAGVVTRPRDPLHALRHHGVGMTDLVKRATVRAAELTAEEYAAGVRRVEALCRWLRPGAVCFVGLAGWRSAVDRRAVAGVQPGGFGGVPAYLMPSTSGLNAHSRPADLAGHLRAAMALAGG